MRRGPFLVLFAVSGAAALIYEVVWTRLLTLHLGHGVAAASTVLASFMGGLAAGAAMGGRVGERLTPARALRAYAALEAAVAVVAAVLPFALNALTPLMAAMYADGNGRVAYPLFRIVSSLVLLALPAAAMGATFPIASRWAVRGHGTLTRDAGALYAANTVGAAIGALLAGFALLPTLGVSGSTAVGIVLNLLAAGGAYVLARQAPAGDAAPVAAPRQEAGRKSKQGKTDRAPAPAGDRVSLAAVALGISGFASLSLQVVWTRLLASILGPTTYAFSTIVTVFILGIAGGATIGARLAARAKQPATGLAWCLLISSGVAVAGAAGVDWTLLQVARAVAQPGAEFASVLTREVLLTAALLLPMTIAFGAAFPFGLAVASGGGSASVSGVLGSVYAVNTVGAIIGSLLAGFGLVPAFGLHVTLQIVAAVSALGAAGVLLAARASGSGRTLVLAGAVTALAAAWMAPGWDPALLSSGAYKYAASLRGPDLQTALTAGEIVYYREGAAATVAVRRLAGTMSLSIDGKVDASNAGDMLTQRMLAHVPLLLHPNPKRAAILGLGSGVTLGSALTHPLDRADVLEISPEVVEASRFFDAENHRALDDPRTRLIVGDGRTHLVLSNAEYDVIVSEPSNPWMAGIATLFTREFFEAAQARLAPGGILCQWAHTYDISTADLKSIVATFSSVFPDGTLWLVGDADVLLVGSTGPLTDRIGGIGGAWGRPGVAADLASVGARDPLAVLSMFVADGAALRQWSAGALLQTDNRAPLEFSGPRSIFGLTRDDNPAAIRDLAVLQPPPAAVERALSTADGAAWRRAGQMAQQADAYRTASAHFTRAIERDPEDREALDGLVRASAPLGKTADTRAFLTRLASAPGRMAAKLALSSLLAAEGAFDESVRIPLGVLQSDPVNLPALEQLASILSDAGDGDRLAPVVARLQSLAPATSTTKYYAASLAFIRQRPDLAVRDAEASVQADPSNAKARNLLGAALASLGQRDRAREAFLASLAADPREPATYTNLATLELESGNRVRAKQYFAEALTVDPTNTVARDGLLGLIGSR